MIAFGQRQSCCVSVTTSHRRLGSLLTVLQIVGYCLEVQGCINTSFDSLPLSTDIPFLVLSCIFMTTVVCVTVMASHSIAA
jgi:hypothetical protein